MKLKKIFIPYFWGGVPPDGVENSILFFFFIKPFPYLKLADFILSYY